MLPSVIWSSVEGIVAVIEATPLVTVAALPLKETPVNVPAFLVNPQPETVDSVGIISFAHVAAPFTTLNTFPLSEVLVLGRGVVTLTPLEFTVKPLFEGTLTE